MCEDHNHKYTYSDPIDAFASCLVGSVSLIGKMMGQALDKYYNAGQKNPRGQLERFFRNKNMIIERKGEIVERPHIAKINRTEYGYHIIMGLYPGLSLHSFKKDELEAALNAEVEAYVDQSGWAHLKVYTRRTPKRFIYNPGTASHIKKFSCAIPIGLSRQGFVMLDMARDENFALLVGGMPGFGKSRFLTQAIASVVLNYGPDQVQLYLTDMKNGVEFARFQTVPHLIDWAGDLPGAGRVLFKANQELDRRAMLMRKARVTNIQEYNQDAKDTLPHILAVIDEYADLGAKEKEQVTRLCRMGRFAGLHPIVCTQRPSHTVLPGDTKALMPVTLCFRTRNELNSNMILGDKMPYAAYLKGKGRGLLLTHRLREVQVMDLNPQLADKMILKRFPVTGKTYQLKTKKAASW